MRVKLTDLYDTKYFYVSFKNDLTYLFDNVLKLSRGENINPNVGNDKIGEVYNCARVGTPLEFDIADAHFTSDCTSYLVTYAKKGIVFVDSSNYWRNKILETNRERVAEAVQYADEIPLPAFKVDDSAPDYIQALSKDVVYRISPNNQDVVLPLTTLIIIYRPSIKLHIDDVAIPLFRYVARFITPAEAKRFGEYYMVTAEGISVVEKADKIYVQQLGTVDFETASTVADFVPTDFGKVRLTNDPLFRVIAQQCLNVLNEYKSRKPLRLQDVLTRS